MPLRRGQRKLLILLLSDPSYPDKRHSDERETVSVSNSAGSSKQFCPCVQFHWCRINSTRTLFRGNSVPIRHDRLLVLLAGHCCTYCQWHTGRKLKPASFRPTAQAPGQEWVRMVKATWNRQYNPLTYLLTYSIVQSPSWAANRFAASQEIPRISRNPKVHYRTNKRPPPVSILGQQNPVHIPTSHLLEIRPNIIHPSTPRSPHWSPSLRFPQQGCYVTYYQNYQLQIISIFLRIMLTYIIWECK